MFKSSTSNSVGIPIFVEILLVVFAEISIFEQNNRTKLGQICSLRTKIFV